MNLSLEGRLNQLKKQVWDTNWEAHSDHLYIANRALSKRNLLKRRNLLKLPFQNPLSREIQRKKISNSDLVISLGNKGKLKIHHRRLKGQKEEAQYLKNGKSKISRPDSCHFFQSLSAKKEKHLCLPRPSLRSQLLKVGFYSHSQKNQEPYLKEIQLRVPNKLAEPELYPPLLGSFLQRKAKLINSKT